MARIRSSSASQTATVPVRTLSLLCSLFLLFLGILYLSYHFIGPKSTVKATNNTNVHSHQQFHSRTTPIVHQNSINRIVQENMKQGTPRAVWWTNQTAGEPVIEGFTNEFSYLPGEDIQFKIHSEELLLRSSVARYVHPDDPIQVCSLDIVYVVVASFSYHTLSHPLTP